MVAADVYSKLQGVFAEIFDDDSIHLTADMSASEVDGWDSLTHFRIILTVERAFHVKFSSSDIVNLEKVGDLVTLIQAHLPASQ